MTSDNPRTSERGTIVPVRFAGSPLDSSGTDTPPVPTTTDRDEAAMQRLRHPFTPSPRH